MITVTRFTSKTCAPCRLLAPVFDQLKQEFAWKAQFSTIDIEENPSYKESKGISGVPMVIIESNGREVSRLMGVKAKSVYVSILESL